MFTPTDLPAMPVGIVHALGQLAAFGGLLAIADPQKWDSLARPAATQLAALAQAVHAELEAELSQHFGPPSP